MAGLAVPTGVLARRWYRLFVGARAGAVADDGRGIAEPAEESPGLESMRARAEQLGGRLQIHGERRAGMRVEIEVPLRGDDGAGPPP
jgi:hypothetical protein